jgi:O-methyltransferase involved in polyketide biosynthesis
MDAEARPAMEQGHERISPTAWGIAYRRTFFDIPHSTEIFHELQRIMEPPELTSELLDEKASAHDLQFEARFRLVSRLLKEKGADQVLEIASGFSPRGLILAQDPSITYVELDLQGILRAKRDIVEKLVQQSKVPRQSNLHFWEGNALEQQDLQGAVRTFRDRPIAVIHEGLLRYLSFQEQALMAENIHCLLERFGGVWITPDISVKKKGSSVPDEKTKEQNLREQHMTGIDLTKNRFDSEEAACRFFEGLGFTVERHSFMEAADELVLPQRLKLTREQVAERIGRSVAFVMRLPN